MGQIKYIVSACLILLVCSIIIFSFQKLSSTEIIANRSTTINFDEVSLSHEIETSNIKGQRIFRQNCASCHALDKIICGPGLRGFDRRGPWPEDKENFNKWVKNPAAFIPTTEYTKDLQKAYGQIMPSFPQLTREELEAIYEYISNAPKQENSIIVN
jgi:mono/diheme cytochrome c family protein